MKRKVIIQRAAVASALIVGSVTLNIGRALGLSGSRALGFCAGRELRESGGRDTSPAFHRRSYLLRLTGECLR